ALNHVPFLPEHETTAVLVWLEAAPACLGYSVPLCAPASLGRATRTARVPQSGCRRAQCSPGTPAPASTLPHRVGRTSVARRQMVAAAAPRLYGSSAVLTRGTAPRRIKMPVR